MAWPRYEGLRPIYLESDRKQMQLNQRVIDAESESHCIAQMQNRLHLIRSYILNNLSELRTAEAELEKKIASREKRIPRFLSVFSASGRRRLSELRDSKHHNAARIYNWEREIQDMTFHGEEPSWVLDWWLSNSQKPPHLVQKTELLLCNCQLKTVLLHITAVISIAGMFSGFLCSQRVPVSS